MKSILIKSEMDTRPVIYSLMRALSPLGNVLLITRNETLTRLIDGEVDGTFRNFRILIDSEGATDDLLINVGVDLNEYSYVIYDNVGTVEYDYLLIPISSHISEWFYTDISYIDLENVTFIKYGKNKKTNIDELIDSALTIEEETDEDKALALHSNTGAKSSMSDKISKTVQAKFPLLDDIESFESLKKFYKPDIPILKLFYSIFKDDIGTSESNFIKEVSNLK